MHRYNYCKICGAYGELNKDDICITCLEMKIVEMIQIIKIGNYYGTPKFIKFQDGTHAFGLDDYDENKSIPISTEFYEAVKKEFTTKLS